MSDRTPAIHRGLLGLIALPLCMCAGTETDNPVTDFSSSECKNHTESALTVAPSVTGTRAALTRVTRTKAALDQDDHAYDGLYCLAWEARESDVLTVDVINYKAGCGLMWELGDGTREGDHVELAFRKWACASAACGWCLYDLSFEVKDVPSDEYLYVDLTEQDCHGDVAAREGSVLLPLTEQSSGVRCREQGAVEIGLECGRAYYPACTSDVEVPGSCEAGGASACEQGLICVHEGGMPRDTCYTACEEDADCPLPVEACRDGACRLRDAF